MSHQNNPDLFPNLRAVRLEAIAHKWGNTESFKSFIYRISLYEAPVEDYSFRVKYVMLFEITETSLKNGYEEYDGQFGDCLAGTHPLRCLVTKQKDFKEVYKETPPDSFLDEWAFVTKLPEGITEKYFWLLFSVTEEVGNVVETSPVPDKTRKARKAQQLDWEKVDRILKEAGAEISVIYDAIKQLGLSAPQEKLQMEALARFRDDDVNFKLIKQGYLEDISLYAVNPGHEKRDFWGALFKKIIKEETGHDIGGQKLEERYREII
jgi:hypothetical protein